eukprot:757377_1
MATYQITVKNPYSIDYDFTRALPTRARHGALFSVADLKAIIRDEYRGNPATPDQRIIFQGRMLADDTLLRDLLDRSRGAQSTPLMFHISLKGASQKAFLAECKVVADAVTASQAATASSPMATTSSPVATASSPPEVQQPPPSNASVQSQFPYQPYYARPMYNFPQAMNPVAMNPAAMNPAAMNPAAMNPAAMNPAAMNPAMYFPQMNLPQAYYGFSNAPIYPPQGAYLIRSPVNMQFAMPAAPPVINHVLPHVGGQVQPPAAPGLANVQAPANIPVNVDAVANAAPEQRRRVWRINIDLGIICRLVVFLMLFGNGDIFSRRMCLLVCFSVVYYLLQTGAASWCLRQLKAVW